MCEKTIVDVLVQKIIKKEKEFLNEKSMREREKVKQIKRILEEVVE